MLVAIAAITSCRSKPPPAAALVVDERVLITATWSVVVPREMKRVDNGDSWQTYDDHRAVYVAGITATAPDTSAPSNVDDLAAAAAEALAKHEGRRTTRRTPGTSAPPRSRASA